jgi:hypothetical protein
MAKSWQDLVAEMGVGMGEPTASLMANPGPDPQPNQQQNDAFINSLMSGTGLESGATPTPQAPPQQISPKVAEYIKAKSQPKPASVDESVQPQSTFNNPLANFGDDKYKAALADSQQRQSGLGMAQMAAGIGDALARKDSSGTDKFFDNARANIQDQTVGEYNRQKATSLSDFKSKQSIDATDPNSEKSVSFRKLVESTMPNIAKSYGKNWNMVTEADKDSILDFGKMRENIDARKETARILMNQREEARQDKMSAGAAKAQELSTTRAKQMGLNAKDNWIKQPI